MTNEMRIELINELSIELGIDNESLNGAIDKELDLSSLDSVLNGIDTDKLENSDSVNIDDLIDTVEFWYDTIETTDNETVETVETTDNETVETTDQPSTEIGNMLKSLNVEKPTFYVIKVSNKELDLIKSVVDIEDVNIKELSTDNKTANSDKSDKSTLDGKSIKGIRQSLGCSQEILAMLLGMSKSSSAAISDWENDRFSIPNKHVDKLLSLTKEKVNMFKESLK